MFKNLFDKEMYIELDELKEDEYIGENGLPYCKKCHTPRYCTNAARTIVMSCMCDCQVEAYEKKKQREKEEAAVEEFNNRSKLSMIGERYKNLKFADATITDKNREIYQKCRNYVNSAKEVRENNIGLYIFGNNSSGKTFLTACICNELLWKGFRCVYTNLATILNEIRSSYNGVGMGECEIINKLQSYDFAFIDDLGKEFIGREYNASLSKWAEEKLFEMINSRYNAQKPTVFTSNYSITDLERIIKLDKAIVERINEMSTRVLNLKGEDFREKSRLNKNAIAKKLGI